MHLPAPILTHQPAPTRTHPHPPTHPEHTRTHIPRTHLQTPNTPAPTYREHTYRPRTHPHPHTANTPTDPEHTRTHISQTHPHPHTPNTPAPTGTEHTRTHTLVHQLSTLGGLGRIQANLGRPSIRTSNYAVKVLILGAMGLFRHTRRVIR